MVMDELVQGSLWNDLFIQLTIFFTFRAFFVQPKKDRINSMSSFSALVPVMPKKKKKKVAQYNKLWETYC